MYIGSFARWLKDDFYPFLSLKKILVLMTLGRCPSHPGLSLPSDPVSGEPLLCGAADSNGPTPAIHPGRQAAHEAPQRSRSSHPAYS